MNSGQTSFKASRKLEECVAVKGLVSLEFCMDCCQSLNFFPSVGFDPWE